MYVHYYGYSCIQYISYEFLGIFEAAQGVSRSCTGQVLLQYSLIW